MIWTALQDNCGNTGEGKTISISEPLPRLLFRAPSFVDDLDNHQSGPEEAHITTTDSSTEQANKQAVRQSTEQAGKYIDNQLGRQTYNQPHQRASGQAIDNYQWIPLTRNQSSILFFLYEKGGGLTSMRQIVESTGIPYGTARSAINVLKIEGYILNKKQYNSHVIRGFSYSLDTNRCALYVLGVRERGQNNNLSEHQPIQQPFQQADNQAANHIEEGSFKKNLTSSNIGGSVKSYIRGLELDEPELSWWSIHWGLTTAKTAEWLRQFECQGLTPQDLSRSLKFAWFDVTVNQIQPGGKPIERALNWFFKHLPGGYAQPTNYKSHKQLQIDQERQELEEMERKVQELADIRRLKQIKELELKFHQILDGKLDEEYQFLLAQVSAFELDMGGDVLTAALKRTYLENHGIIQP